MNTYHRTIKMKPAYVKSGANIDLQIENNEKDGKFKAGSGSIVIEGARKLFIFLITH